MINRLILADIDFAKRRMQEGASDAEIISNLVARKVESGLAANLVAELRAGKEIRLDSLLLPRPDWPPKGSADVPSEQPRRRRSQPSRSSQRSERSSSRHSHQRPASAGAKLMRYIIGFFVVLLAGILLFHFRKSLLPAPPTGATPPESKTVSNSTANATTRPRGALEHIPLPSGPPLLELQSDGLHAKNGIVKAEDALTVLSRAFGAPSHTNHLDQPGKLVYAFDTMGILVYSQEGAAEDCVVLDFKGLGGNTGTTHAYPGKLRIDKHDIYAGTELTALTAMQSLELDKSGTAGGILKGTFGKSGLYFAYLQSTQRLSLVQINLK